MLRERFTSKFRVIEIRKDGTKIVHFLKGKDNEVKKDVEMFKDFGRDYMMINKKAMIVWM